MFAYVLQLLLQADPDLDAAIAADQAQVAPAPRPSSGGNLMNPEISLIGTFAGSWRRDEADPTSFQAGDDPTPSGLTAQELELTFAADVDPYFKMRAFLAIPNGEGVEIEEAYLLTTSLPASLQLKGGVFRSAFGRNNEQHLHAQDLARRPRLTALLADDGLRGPGAQLSWLTPLPWFSVIYVEALTLAAVDSIEDTSVTAVVEQFFDVTDAWSLLWGVSGGTLASPTVREWVAGSDVYLKWKPANVTSTYAWFALTAEGVARRRDDDTWAVSSYAQLVAQVARRWRVAARYDLFDDAALTEHVVSASLAFLPTEFSRVRLTWQHEESNPQSRNDAVILQLEGSIGAHSAHPF